MASQAPLEFPQASWSHTRLSNCHQNYRRLHRSHRTYRHLPYTTHHHQNHFAPPACFTWAGLAARGCPCICSWLSWHHLQAVCSSNFRCYCSSLAASCCRCFLITISVGGQQRRQDHRFLHDLLWWKSLMMKRRCWTLDGGGRGGRQSFVFRHDLCWFLWRVCHWW